MTAVRIISLHVFGLSESESQKMICQNVVHTSPGGCTEPVWTNVSGIQKAEIGTKSNCFDAHGSTWGLISFQTRFIVTLPLSCFFLLFFSLFKHPCRQKMKKTKLQFGQMQLQFRGSGRWPEDFKYATQPERWRLRRCGSICIAELLNVYVCKCELRPWN